jgi:hypothetical protein
MKDQERLVVYVPEENVRPILYGPEHHPRPEIKNTIFFYMKNV